MKLVEHDKKSLYSWLLVKKFERMTSKYYNKELSTKQEKQYERISLLIQSAVAKRWSEK